MRAGAAFAALLASAGVAASATLDLPGNYGSPEGCEYLRDSTSWQEGLTLLTPTRYKDFVTDCEFVQVLPASDGSRIVTMLCQQELDVQTIEMVRVVKVADRDAYGIFTATGDRWAELAACEPK